MFICSFFLPRCSATISGLDLSAIWAKKIRTKKTQLVVWQTGIRHLPPSPFRPGAARNPQKRQPRSAPRAGLRLPLIHPPIPTGSIPRRFPKFETVCHAILKKTIQVQELQPRVPLNIGCLFARSLCPATWRYFLGLIQRHLG